MSLHCNRRTQLLLLTGLILLVLLVAFLAGRLIPDSAVAADFAQAKEPPSWSHPFGTDHLGRDLFLRTLKGLSTSLTVGICASAISAVAAVLCGYCPMGEDILVRLRGGDLTIRYEQDRVWMTGEAVTVFQGTVKI